MTAIVGENTSAQSNPTIESLQIALDAVWTQYLSLLDQYHGLRQEFASDLANGHFNLARANLNNAHRLRFGKDYYDERMQASTCVSGDLKDVLFRLTDSPVENTKVSYSLSRSNLGRNSGMSAPAKAQMTSIAKDRAIANAETSTKDPLVWFGVLVPAALKTTQSAFKDAVIKAAKLVSLDTEMKVLEIEIRRTRKKLRKAL